MHFEMKKKLFFILKNKKLFLEKQHLNQIIALH